MGFSGSSRTTTSNSTTKPVYEGRVLGAADNVDNAFAQNQGNLDNVQGILSGLLPTAQANYANNGTLNAAKGYVTSTLGNNTYAPDSNLQDLIKYSNADVSNGVAAGMGTRGLTGGSAMAKIMAGQLAKNESGLLYNDYNNWQNRRAQAAGMAPGLASADATNLNSMLSLGDQAANLSTNNALKHAMGVGGLLGQYTNTDGTQKEKTSGSLGGFLGALLISAASQAGSFVGGG